MVEYQQFHMAQTNKFFLALHKLSIEKEGETISYLKINH